MSKGFLWFCQNSGDVDYAKCSIALAQSIKKFNRENAVCVITDEQSKFQHPSVDIVKVLSTDDSESHTIKWANEHKAVRLSPFTHTIKLEADMLWTRNTDWWWHYLAQHNMIFSIDCKNYKDETVKDTVYRRLFVKNNLPNLYNGMTYFRRSEEAIRFYQMCEKLTSNWTYVRDNLLINCHDPYPSTDVIYALAYRIMDPTNERLINYDWFKFIHHKPAIHGLNHVKDYDAYLNPVITDNGVFLGGRRLDRVWHYVNKNTVEELHARIF